MRQTEGLVESISSQPSAVKPKPAPSPEISALEERLRTRLGTKVRLNRSSKGGSLVIYFFSDEEFNALLGNILGEED